MGSLTVLGAKKLKEPGRYSDGKGLILHIRESGARAWVLRIQVDGKRRDFGLGSFEDVSLSDARDRAEELRKQAKSGIDPVAAKKAARVAAEPAMTFREAAVKAHDEHKGGWRNAKHEAQWLSSIETYAYPAIGDLAVDEVEGPAVRDLLAEIWLSKPETARRVRQRIGVVMDWAYAKGLRKSEFSMRSVGRGLPRQPSKDRHHEAMDYDQVPLLMKKLETAETIGRLALRFTILTAARSGEVRHALWSEIDLAAATWTIPGERMKAGKTHIVPLSKSALEVLKLVKAGHGDAPDAIIFPGNRSKLKPGNNALSDMTLLKVLRDNWPSTLTVHGFRSSFRDWAAEQTAFSGDVVEAALAHTIANRVEAAYRRTNYLEKRRLLMTDWSNYISLTPA